MSDSAASDRTPRVAVYAGVFDPPTMAHLEIIESALRIFDELVVLVSHRVPRDGLLAALRDWDGDVRVIGDAVTPRDLAASIAEGYRLGLEL